ncbi:MAG: proteasome subunit beta [Candidatus Anstonellales archaeon]
MQSIENEKDLRKFTTGTTTVGIKASDGVVLLADKRVTMSNYILSKEITKIIPFAKHLAITLSGAVGDNQLIGRWLSIEVQRYEREQEKPMSPKSAAVLLANILSSYRYYPFWVMNLLAGYDYEENKPYLYSIDLIGGVTEERIASSGSGSLIAFGVLDSLYKDGIKVDEAINIGVKAVNAAMNRDSASGDGIDIFVITKDGGRFFKQAKQDKQDNEKSSENEVREIKVQKRKK